MIKRILCFMIGLAMTAACMACSNRETNEGIINNEHNNVSTVSESRTTYETVMSEENIDIDTAYNLLTKDTASGPEVTQLIQKIEELKKCEGRFVIESEETGNRYAADVEFYLRDGVVYGAVDYTGYMGTIEDAKVIDSEEEGYSFESFPKGEYYGREQEFSIYYSETLLHIKWADTNDYILDRGDGSVESAQEYTTPFEETKTYASIADTVDNMFKNNDHSLRYDPDEKALYVYVEAPESARAYLTTGTGNNVDEMLGLWSQLAEGTQKIGETLYTLLHAGKYGDHAYIYYVDRLDSNDVYEEDDYLLCIDNGEIAYDITDDRKDSISNRKRESEKTTEKTDTTNTLPKNSSHSSMGERNALQKAHDYLDYTAFSYSGLIEQLEFEGFSTSEATYAADNCGADWYEQAAEKAAQYLDYTSFSYEGLIEQLEFEGFTHDEAVYGADQNWD